MNSVNIEEDINENIVIPKKRGRKPKPKILNEEIQKIPKKRGRKPKPKSDIQETPKIPKKRGRKPKPKLEMNEVKIPKKRGRKPKDKYGIIPKETGNIASMNSDSDNIILHLPIRTSQIESYSLEKNGLDYDPNIVEPIPYEQNNSTYSSFYNNPVDSNNDDNNDDDDENKKEENEFIENDLINENDLIEETKLIHVNDLTKKKDIGNNEKEEIIKCKYIDKNNEEIELLKIPLYKVNYGANRNTKLNSTSTMYQFEESNKRLEVPRSTNIHCFWCCHVFNNTPCVLPINFEKNIYKVYGCFCSPECAAAFNFSCNLDNEKEWERYSLLNDLYKRVYDDNEYNIKLAPPRNVLSIFGGSMSIDEFRNLNSNYNRKINIIMPPLLSIIPQVEESNLESNENSNKNFIPIDKDRIQKANDDLRLKRNRPVTETVNTLENCMRLKYI